MTEFVSEEKIIPYSDVEVFRVLSDLQKLESMKHLIPEDKLSDFSFDADMVTFRIDLRTGVGRYICVDPGTAVDLGFQCRSPDFGIGWLLLPQPDRDFNHDSRIFYST